MSSLSRLRKLSFGFAAFLLDALLSGRGQYIYPYAAVPGDAPNLIPASSAASGSSASMSLDGRWWPSQPGRNSSMRSFHHSSEDGPSAFYRYAPPTIVQAPSVGFVGRYGSGMYSVPHHPHTPYIMGPGADCHVPPSGAVPVFSPSSPSVSSARRSSRSGSSSSMGSASGSSGSYAAQEAAEPGMSSNARSGRASPMSHTSSRSASLRMQLVSRNSLAKKSKSSPATSMDGTLNPRSEAVHSGSESADQNQWTGSNHEEVEADGDEDGDVERETEDEEKQDEHEQDEEEHGEEELQADRREGTLTGNIHENVEDEDGEQCESDSDGSAQSSGSPMPDPRIGYGLGIIPTSKRSGVQLSPAKQAPMKRAAPRASGLPRKRVCNAATRQSSPSDDTEDSSLESDSESGSESDSNSGSESEDGSTMESSSSSGSVSSEESDSESESSNSDAAEPQWRGRQLPGKL